MFTRTNIVVAIFLFILFLIILLAFFSPIGLLEYKDLERESLRLGSMVERQSAKLNLMRQSRGLEQARDDEELILSFDDVYNPIAESDETISQFQPLGYFSIVFISIIPSFVYLLICVLYKKLRKRR